MAGLMILGFALLLGFSFGMFKRLPNQRKVRGTILAAEPQDDFGQKHPKCLAVVEFQADGASRTAKTTYKSASFRLGDHLTVLYDAENPENAFVRPRPGLYLAICLLFVFGVIVTLKIYLGA